jgi:glycosyltransferase involved in cell wall biosynthesis
VFAAGRNVEVGSYHRPVPPGARVLLVCQPTTGGAAVCVANLARAAVAAGLDVTVACPDEGDLATWTKEAGAIWEPIPLVRSPAPSDLRRAMELRRLIARADLVHLHSSKAAAVGRLALRSLGPRRPPAVFSPHGWSWHVGGRLVPLYRGVERLTAPWVDAIVAVSAAEADEGRQVLGRRARDLRVVENGVDATATFTPDGPHAGRSADPLVVCVGRLTEAKGQAVAVRALASSRNPRTRLRLVGDGPDRPELVALTERMGVADRVELPGWTDPAPHLRAADVVVVPSRWDGLSLALLEAMACGRPVVATRVPGSGALGGTGVLVRPDAPDELARAVDDLLDDPDRRDRLGRSARQRVLDRYRLDQSTSGTLEIWEALLPAPLEARQ